MVYKPNITSDTLTNSYTAPVLHVFRALLRQCTYLPDPNARAYLQKHVVSRFRAYCPHPTRSLRRDFKNANVLVDRRPQLLKKARKGLVSLDRANHGHQAHLTKVLELTYGRIGPRRHVLLEALKVPDFPPNSSELSQVLKRMADPAEQNVPHPSEQLLSLAKSQAKRKESFAARKTLRHVSPQIPATNSWGRPMPIKRVRNMKRRWYAYLLERVMPPLPEAEWDILHKLSLGKIPFYGPVTRRGPLSQQDNIGSRTFNRIGTTSRPHELTPRYMRRMWGNILKQCPCMHRRPERKTGWEVRWADLKQESGIGLQPIGGDITSLFEGVDLRGKVLTAG